MRWKAPVAESRIHAVTSAQRSMDRMAWSFHQHSRGVADLCERLGQSKELPGHFGGLVLDSMEASVLEGDGCAGGERLQEPHVFRRRTDRYRGWRGRPPRRGGRRAA